MRVSVSGGWKKKKIDRRDGNSGHMTRREFLKAGIGLAAVASGFEMFPIEPQPKILKIKYSQKKKKRITKYILQTMVVLWVFIKNNTESSR